MANADGVRSLFDPAFVDVTEIPSYKDCILRVYEGLKFYYEHNTLVNNYPYSLSGFWGQVRDLGHITAFDVGVTVTGALAWTLVRYLLTWAIFAPFARSMKMKSSDTKKLPESMWKVIVYSMLWGLSSYILFFSDKHTDIFEETVAVWKDIVVGGDVGRLIYCLYMAELSFYLHSVYGTLFMDEWRKDSAVMLFHHFLTMSLIGFSYAMRFHKIGVIVLFVHDVTDILLEFTKCNVYLKKRNGVYYAFHDHMSTVGFASFAVAWFVFRLYWYPLKVLYSTAYGSIIFHPNGVDCPTYYFFNVMLFILQILNIYWFTFIVVFLFNVLTGRQKDVEDIREMDVDAEIKAASTTTKTNGTNLTPRRSSRNKAKKRD